jgi:hypothetical protein
MEQYIQGQSRDLTDKAYTKLVSISPFKFAFLCVYVLLNVKHKLDSSSVCSLFF